MGSCGLGSGGVGTALFHFQGREKCGDGKPSPYSSEVIDGWGGQLLEAEISFEPGRREKYALAARPSLSSLPMFTRSHRAFQGQSQKV